MKAKKSKARLQDVLDQVDTGEIAIEVVNGKASYIPKQTIAARSQFGIIRRITIEQPIQIIK